VQTAFRRFLVVQSESLVVALVAPVAVPERMTTFALAVRPALWMPVGS
jgi:hypothetical protein